MMPSFHSEGTLPVTQTLLTQRYQITSLEISDPRLPYSENLESLSHLGLIRYRVVTPQTDRGQNSHS